MHWKRALATAALLAGSVVTSGCYLAHVARGQVRLLWARIPVEDVLRESDTPDDLRAHLARVDEVRRYAEGLGLRVGDRYTAYAPWPGDAVVTAVIATRPGEVTPVTTWFPIVGDAPYLGYFDAERAEGEAQRLRERNLDVCVVKVRAYSTLGWFDDPLTGPMLRLDEPTLVETVFHELLHATVFVADEADFNEGVAAFFGQEARVRFYADRGDAAQGERERRAVDQERQLSAEVQELRSRVQALYGSAPAGPERDARRAQLEAETRERIGALELAGYDPARAAVQLPLNDACLALSGTYHADTARLAAVLDSLGGDLTAFVARVKLAAQADDPRGDLLGSAPPAL